MRARFLAKRGWTELHDAPAEIHERDRVLAGFQSAEEVVLWFGHDLSDQLQFFQLLDWFAGQDLGTTRLSVICAAAYLGALPPEAVRDFFPTRRSVSARELELGREAWDAFRSPDPNRLIALLKGDTSALAFLEGALARHLEQYPSVRNGLSRSEAQALKVVVGGEDRLVCVWVASQLDMEERISLDDGSFVEIIRDLCSGPAPLLELEERPHDPGKPPPSESARYWRSKVTATATGHEVLEGRRDWIKIRGIELSRCAAGRDLFASPLGCQGDVCSRRSEVKGVAARVGC